MLISVSVDEDLKALKNMVARKGMSWPQVWDGEGNSHRLARLFNAGTPTHYVLDRDGKIAAKHMGSQGLDKMVRVIERILAESH